MDISKLSVLSQFSCYVDTKLPTITSDILNVVIRIYIACTLKFLTLNSIAISTNFYETLQYYTYEIPRVTLPD